MTDVLGCLARRKAHCRLSIRINWTFFTIYYGSELWGEICTAWLLLPRSTTKILPEHRPPLSTILGTRKLETLGYPIPLRSLILTQYPSVTDTRMDRRTEKTWICRSISLHSACKASFGLRRVVKTFVNAGKRIVVLSTHTWSELGHVPLACTNRAKLQIIYKLQCNRHTCQTVAEQYSAMHCTTHAIPNSSLNNVLLQIMSCNIVKALKCLCFCTTFYTPSSSANILKIG